MSLESDPSDLTPATGPAVLARLPDPDPIAAASEQAFVAFLFLALHASRTRNLCG